MSKLHQYKKMCLNVYGEPKSKEAREMLSTKIKDWPVQDKLNFMDQYGKLQQDHILEQSLIK